MDKPPVASILIVDDDGDLLEVLKFVLEDAGYQTFAASSGADALAMAAKESIDLVILDISMAAMSGIEVARALRADARTAGILIALHTGRSEEEVSSQFADFDLFMPKVDDAEVLLRRLSVALESRQSILRGQPMDQAGAPVLPDERVESEL